MPGPAPPAPTSLAVAPFETTGDGDWARTLGTRYGSHSAFSIIGNLGKKSIAVDLKSGAGKRVVVIGSGEMLDEIRRIAGPTITVMGSQPFDVLKHHYSQCQALIFPGEEDFGMVPVEAMASGRPVVAFARGGATETVLQGISGVFFGEQTVEAICKSVRSLAEMECDPARIAAHARQFGRDQFFNKMRTHIDGLMAKRVAAHLV